MQGLQCCLCIPPHLVCQEKNFPTYIPGGPTPSLAGPPIEVPDQTRHSIKFIYNDTPYLVDRDPNHTIYRLIHRVKV